MITNELENFQLHDSHFLHLKEKKTYATLNKETICETLKTFFKEKKTGNSTDEYAERTTDALIESREAKFNKFLKFSKK